MTLISVALYIEALALIEKLKLKKIEDRFFQIFQNSNYIVVITGVGVINSAIASTYIFSKYQIRRAINFGVAGSLNSKIGSIFLINQVLDIERGRELFPDILISHSFQESSISTFSKPIERDIELKSDLVDMESSGFLDASLKFLSPDRVAILKIVSDNLESKMLNREFVKSLTLSHIETIVEFLSDFSKERETLLTQVEIERVNTLNLSKSQRIKVLDWIKFIKIDRGSLDKVWKILSKEISSKRERVEFMQELESETFK